MSDCDARMFKIIFGKELTANCTEGLKALPHTDHTCGHCWSCVENADAASVEKVLKTPSSEVCAVMLDVETCDLSTFPSDDAALLAAQVHDEAMALKSADLRKRLRNSRSTVNDAVALKTNC